MDKVIKEDLPKLQPQLTPYIRQRIEAIITLYTIYEVVLEKGADFANIAEDLKRTIWQWIHETMEMKEEWIHTPEK